MFGAAWNARFGDRKVPVNGTANIAPGKYDAFVQMISDRYPAVCWVNKKGRIVGKQSDLLSSPISCQPLSAESG